MKIRISGWEVEYKGGSVGAVLPMRQPVSKGKSGNNKGLKNTKRR